MRLFRDKSRVIAAEEALPGRNERMTVPAAHYVNRNPLEPPYPDGLELALFGMG